MHKNKKKSYCIFWKRMKFQWRSLNFRNAEYFLLYFKEKQAELENTYVSVQTPSRVNFQLFWIWSMDFEPNWAYIPCFAKLTFFSDTHIAKVRAGSKEKGAKPENTYCWVQKPNYLQFFLQLWNKEEHIQYFWNLGSFTEIWWALRKCNNIGTFFMTACIKSSY